MQIIGKLLETVKVILSPRYMNTTVYHLQTSGQAKRFRKTILARILHHVAGQERG